MNIDFYAFASFIPNDLPATMSDYYSRCVEIAPKLMTDVNLASAQRFEQKYRLNGGFVYRDSPDRLLLFRMPHPDALRNKHRGIVLPGTFLPELEVGQGIGLGFLLSGAGLALVPERENNDDKKPVNDKEKNLFDDNPWLDPNYPSPITMQIDGKGKRLTFESAQAAYQAHKCPRFAEKFTEMDADEAWKFGQTAERAYIWNHDRKAEAMHRVLEAKFTGNTELYWSLLSLRDPQIGYAGIRILADYASSYGHDIPFGTFWGTATSTNNKSLNTDTGRALNTLGELLMSVRAKLLQSAPSITLLQALTMTSASHDAWSGDCLPVFIKTLGDDTRLKFLPSHDVYDVRNRYPVLSSQFDLFKTHVVRILPAMNTSHEPSLPPMLAGLEFTVY